MDDTNEKALATSLQRYDEFIFFYHCYTLLKLAASKLGRSEQPGQRAGSGKWPGNNY